MSEQKLDLILNKLDVVESRLDTVESRLDKLETAQQSHGELIRQLIKVVGATNAKLGETNAGVDTIEKKFDRVAVDVDILKENQLKIMNLQQDQQKILERLSIRSVAHEADIAELRRIK
ncbi:hypothetical protein ACF3MZ_14920 [Paenibacillaceae bacterium WGS1546]|uniref:hypothetical protein n=1 Tax=Cohnella sp. WGS1546 TaxID=3366810 RepID=UPI00372D7C74